MNIKVKTEVLKDGKVIRHRFFENNERMSFDQAIGLLDESEEFRTYLTGVLANVPYKSFCWECKPVKIDNIDSGFEFVVIADERLQELSNAAAFDEHMGTGDLVTSFENLGGDAVLVVPEISATVATGYAHFAQFLRKGPEAQQHALWQLLAAEIESNLHSEFIWINTAGHGVPWLHLRIDDKPKYYQFKEYRSLHQSQG